MIVDLHMHATCSDGVYTPEQLTQMAVDAGLSVMAISDHDTVAAYDGSHRFAAGVRVIPAIEISSECDGEDVHILGYGIDTADAGLQAYCAQFKERRFNRALEIVDRCRSLGYDIDRSGIEATLRQGGTVGRPHIARLLVAKGYFPDVKTVFDKLLYRGGPAYVPYHRRSIDDCVALIRQAGGTAILLAGVFSVPLMPGYGYGKAISCFFRTIYMLRFPILTIAMILGLAYLMNYSGMSSTLGLAFTHTGWLFPFFSPLLGWLGVFLTGSDTSSCALFGGMQKDTALAVGMRPELAVASNASGGVTAKMISPQSLSVATAATNNAGQEGKLFRFTIGHSIGMTLVLCVLAYLQAGPLSWMLP